MYLSFIIVDIMYIAEQARRIRQLDAELSHQQRLLDVASNLVSQSKHSRFSPYAKITERRKFTIGNSNSSVSSDEDRPGRSQDEAIRSPEIDRVHNLEERVEGIVKEMADIRWNVVLRMLGISANVADTIIAVAEVHPNAICNHHIVYAVSGLVSAWSGWIKNWPF